MKTKFNMLQQQPIENIDLSYEYLPFGEYLFHQKTLTYHFSNGKAVFLLDDLSVILLDLKTQDVFKLQFSQTPINISSPSIFLDFLGWHCIFSLNSNTFYYLNFHSKIAREVVHDSRMPLSITSVCWNILNKSKEKTGSIILGNTAGDLFKASLSANDSLSLKTIFRSGSKSPIMDLSFLQLLNNSTEKKIIIFFHMDSNFYFNSFRTDEFYCSAPSLSFPKYSLDGRVININLQCLRDNTFVLFFNLSRGTFCFNLSSFIDNPRPESFNKGLSSILPLENIESKDRENRVVQSVCLDSFVFFYTALDIKVYYCNEDCFLEFLRSLDKPKFDIHFVLDNVQNKYFYIDKEGRELGNVSFRGLFKFKRSIYLDSSDFKISFLYSETEEEREFVKLEEAKFYLSKADYHNAFETLEYSPKNNQMFLKEGIGVYMSFLFAKLEGMVAFLIKENNDPDLKKIKTYSKSPSSSKALSTIKKELPNILTYILIENTPEVEPEVSIDRFIESFGAFIVESGFLDEILQLFDAYNKFAEKELLLSKRGLYSLLVRSYELRRNYAEIIEVGFRIIKTIYPKTSTDIFSENKNLTVQKKESLLKDMREVNRTLFENASKEFILNNLTLIFKFLNEQKKFFPVEILEGTSRAIVNRVSLMSSEKNSLSEGEALLFSDLVTQLASFLIELADLYSRGQGENFAEEGNDLGGFCAYLKTQAFVLVEDNREALQNIKTLKNENLRFLKDSLQKLENRVTNLSMGFGNTGPLVKRLVEDKAVSKAKFFEILCHIDRPKLILKLIESREDVIAATEIFLAKQFDSEEKEEFMEGLLNLLIDRELYFQIDELLSKNELALGLVVGLAVKKGKKEAVLAHCLHAQSLWKEKGAREETICKEQINLLTLIKVELLEEENKEARADFLSELCIECEKSIYAESAVGFLCGHSYHLACEKTIKEKKYYNWALPIGEDSGKESNYERACLICGLCDEYVNNSSLNRNALNINGFDYLF